MSGAALDLSKYGPWAVIAGGSDGTGAAFAEEAAKAGLNVLLIARRPAPLDALAGALRTAHGVEVRTLSLDLNAPDAVHRMIAATEKLEVGLYVSNAGAEKGGHTFLDTPLETLFGLIARNVLTVTAACHHFGGLMRTRGRGGIVLMGSGAGLGGQPHVACYSAAKGFVLNLAESLWSELRDDGVDVICIAAPIMETPTLRDTLGDMQIPGIFAADEVARDALRRLPEGCSYVYAFGEPPEESARQTQVRRQRVLFVEAISKSLFAAQP
jgi:short-subunit dehydrogenase